MHGHSTAVPQARTTLGVLLRAPLCPLRLCVILFFSSPYFTTKINVNVFAGAASFSHGRRYPSFTVPVPFFSARNSQSCAPPPPIGFIAGFATYASLTITHSGSGFAKNSHL